MRRVVFPVVCLAASLSLLSACAAAKGNQATLANSTWRFVSIDGAAPVSGKAQLEFEEDRIGATVGCNGMGGPWRIEDGRLIAVYGAFRAMLRSRLCLAHLLEQERSDTARWARQARRYLTLAEHEIAMAS